MGQVSTLDVGEVEKEQAPATGLPTLWPSLTRLEREMERMVEAFWGRPLPFRRDVDRVFGLLGGREIPVDMYEEKDDVVVKAELPGIDKETIEVTLSERRLTIAAERKREAEAGERGRYVAERAYGRLIRSLELPSDIQGDRVKASFTNGVLEIRLPKTEAAKRREVKVTIE